MHGGSRWPLTVAVPLEQIDFALTTGKVIGQPPGRPAPAGEAVEFDPGFPRGANASPPVAADQAAEVLVAVFSGAQNQVGVAVEEHVFPAVAVLPPKLGPVEPHRVLDRRPVRRYGPFRRIGAEPAGPSNSSWNRKPAGLGTGRRAAARTRRISPGFRSGDRGCQGTDPKCQHARCVDSSPAQAQDHSRTRWMATRPGAFWQHSDESSDCRNAQPDVLVAQHVSIRVQRRRDALRGDS